MTTILVLSRAFSAAAMAVAFAAFAATLYVVNEATDESALFMTQTL